MVKKAKKAHQHHARSYIENQCTKSYNLINGII